MKDSYKDWIADYVEGDGYGQCKEVTEAMAAAFPELAQVKGHYYCFTWGEREHRWLKTADGEVVDPTATQFPSKGTGEYVELDETAPRPTGKCPNCGEYCYDGKYCCSDRCHDEYVAYCNNPYSY